VRTWPRHSGPRDPPLLTEVPSMVAARADILAATDWHAEGCTVAGEFLAPGADGAQPGGGAVEGAAWPRRRRAVLTAGIIAVLLLIGVGLQRAVAARDARLGRIVLPGGLLGFSQDLGRKGRTLDRYLDSTWPHRGADPAVDFYVHPASAVYGDLTGSHPAGLIVTAANLAPGYKPFYRSGPAALLAGSSGQLFPAGSQGGVLRCAQSRFSGSEIILCIWWDSRNGGEVAFFGRAAVSLPGAAERADQIRAVIEKR
jgi:hypothetical protein